MNEALELLNCFTPEVNELTNLRDRYYASPDRRDQAYAELLDCVLRSWSEMHPRLLHVEGRIAFLGGDPEVLSPIRAQISQLIRNVTENAREGAPPL